MFRLQTSNLWFCFRNFSSFHSPCLPGDKSWLADVTTELLLVVYTKLWNTLYHDTTLIITLYFANKMQSSCTTYCTGSTCLYIISNGLLILFIALLEELNISHINSTCTVPQTMKGHLFSNCYFCLVDWPPVSGFCSLNIKTTQLYLPVYKIISAFFFQEK